MVLFFENSEVSPVNRFVAVALTVRPGICPSSGKELVQENLALPLALVELLVVSRRRRPSPCAEAGVLFAVRKHCTVKSPSVLLSSLPEMVVSPVAVLLVAEPMMGKFWRAFDPMSVSPGSLAVIPRESSVSRFWNATRTS
jgi:hypothetical protein